MGLCFDQPLTYYEKGGRLCRHTETGPGKANPNSNPQSVGTSQYPPRRGLIVYERFPRALDEQPSRKGCENGQSSAEYLRNVQECAGCRNLAASAATSQPSRSKGCRSLNISRRPSKGRLLSPKRLHNALSHKYLIQVTPIRGQMPLNWCDLGHPLSSYQYSCMAMYPHSSAFL